VLPRILTADGWSVQNYQPHISLHYGESDTRDAAFTSIASDAALKNIKYPVTGVDVVLTDGPVESWKYLGRAPFASSSSSVSASRAVPCSVLILLHVHTENWFLRSGLFIDNEWVAPVQGKQLDVINPATKAAFHQVPAATEEDVNGAVAAAKRAFPGWRDTPVEERARLLRAVAAKLRERVDELAEYEVIDNGKPRKEAAMDVQDTAACFEYYANEIIRVEKEEQNKTVPFWVLGVLVTSPITHCVN
jgi:hypothetical protein